MSDWLERQRSLIGDEATGKLIRSSVIVFGAGGVGGAVLEAFARAGIGKIAVVDHDTVSESNINRQFIADTTTVGMKKTEAAMRRIKAINPAAEVIPIDVFADKSNIPSLFGENKYDFAVDAIDSVTSKLIIIEEAKNRGIGIISSMGTGNKLDPSKFRICDISKTSVCPLARVMRRELKVRGIKDVDVLFSEELPTVHDRVPASISFVPPAAGLMIAGHVIRKIISK